MGGGPPVFKPGSTCPALLWIPARSFRFRVRVFYPLRSDFPVIFRYLPKSLAGPKPQVQAPGLASFPFARRYLENRCFFLFLRVLRCFSSPRSLRTVMYWLYDTYPLRYVGSPIRISAGLGICAPHRSFSQLITSFFGSQCQGIHLMLLFAWSASPCMRYAWSFLSLRTLNCFFETIDRLLISLLVKS